MHQGNPFLRIHHWKFCIMQWIELWLEQPLKYLHAARSSSDYKECNQTFRVLPGYDLKGGNKTLEYYQDMFQRDVIKH